MDKALKNEIMAVVRAAAQQVAEESEERWITGDELGRQFAMFTKTWLRYYGHKLPRTRAIVTDADGSEHATGWCYPQHKIARMIMNNEIKRL